MAKAMPSNVLPCTQNPRKYNARKTAMTTASSAQSAAESFCTVE